MDRSSPLNDLHPSSNHDEIFMQQSLVFSESLKDLRNIRKQMYSAAEFFEDSYHKSDQDQVLFESLKDYVSKALVSTVDHLGSVAAKVDSFLDENMNEAFETNLQVLCIQQRLEKCQKYSDHEGLLQQSFVIQIPRYYKQYKLPDGRFSEAVQTEKAKVESLGLRRGRTERGPTEFRTSSVAFSFGKPESKKRLEKRTRSLSPSRFRIKRSSSSANRSTSPSFPIMQSGSAFYRSISPSTQRHPMEASRSHSLFPERERRKDSMEVYSKKTRNLFKALLSVHKHKNDIH